MNWEGTPVLITGAGGFIGSHLAERLVDEGARVRAFVRYNSRHDVGLLAQLPPDLQAAIEVVAGDLRDGEAVRAAMAGIDVVFHLGALIAIPYSYLHPREVVETNVLGTLNVLMAARDLGTGRVVHTSTSEVYGTARYTPIDEAHSLQGQSPYSASKIGADKLCESFHLSFDLPVAVIRPFNTFGPRQSARAIIPTIVSQALSGDTVRLGSLSPKRDLNYVDNTVDGYLAVAASAKAVGEVINIGSGREISIGDLARRIIALTGTKARIVQDRQRIRPKRSEVGRLLCDRSKARRLLGWRPRISLEEGLRRTIEWMGQNLRDYRPTVYSI